MPEHPVARSEQIVSQAVDGEVVIYDRSNQRAHCLSPEVAAVWSACDGTRAAEGIAQFLDYATTAVEATLALLADSGLLAPPSSGREDGRAVSRRSLLRRGAVAGAAAVGVGTIVSVRVPPAEAAVSGVLALTLYATSVSTCSTAIDTALQRGTVQVTINAAPGQPTMDKLTLVITLTPAYVGFPTDTLNVSINCGPTIGTIPISSTGAGSGTVVTTVPSGQTSHVTLTPQVAMPAAGDTIFSKATPSFTA